MKMKQILALLLAVLMLLAGCAKKTRTVTCDGCGADITVEEDSNITDEWILFCEECDQNIFGGTGVVADN